MNYNCVVHSGAWCRCCSKKLPAVQVTKTITQLWSFWDKAVTEHIQWKTVLTSKSVVIRTRLDPDLNSLMITSRSFWSMSPCWRVKQKTAISTAPMLQNRIFFKEQRHVWIPASLPAVGTKQVGIERKHLTLSRGNDNTALHSYIITFLLLTDISSSPFLLQ